MRAQLLGAVVGTVLVLTGCATGDDAGGTDPQREPVVVDEPETTEATFEEITDETTASEDTTEATGGPFGGDDPEDGLMPDVICMDLQSAQNEIQDHGVFYSGSSDATGRDRNQVIDSNWLVVDQEPSPGTPIGEGDAELYVVKFGEEHESLLPHPC